MGVLERKEREKEQRRKQILEASEKLFLQKGYDNVTMDEIARECELSKGTLYLYYKSKEELFCVLLIKCMDVLIHMFKEGIEGKKSIVEKMQAIGVKYLEFYYKYPQYFKILNYMGEHKSIKSEGMEDLEKQLIKKNKELWDIDVQILEEGKKEGIFKNDFDSFEFSIMLWASSNGVIQVLDHIKSHIGLMDDFNPDDYPFIKINFEKSLYNLWERLLSTILVDKNVSIMLNSYKNQEGL